MNFLARTSSATLLLLFWSTATSANSDTDSKETSDSAESCRSKLSSLDLPRSVLPACSEWRLSELCSDFSDWQKSFLSSDSDGDDLVPLNEVEHIFRHYLQGRNVSYISLDEEIRRFIQVVETDAHIILDICGECFMHWNDFSTLMWGYSRRALGPIQDERTKSEIRDLIIKEFVGQDKKLLSYGAAVADLPRHKQLDYLSTLPVDLRRRAAGIALYLMSADGRAAMIQDLPESERRVLLAKREDRLDLRGNIALVSTAATKPEFRRHASRRLLSTSANSSSFCLACSAGNYLSDCDGGSPGVCTPCQSCGKGQYRLGCAGNSSGTCVDCAAGRIKNYVGVWNSECLACPHGTYSSSNNSFTACFYMYTCRMWLDVGFTSTRTYYLSLNTASVYSSNQSVPFQDDGITPKAGPSRLAYCDMETDGGGWMLILNYNRESSNVEGLVQGVLPLDQTTGFSHQYLMQFSAATSQLVSEIRLFCNSSEHTRTIHFKSTHQGIIGMARRGITANNTATWWNSNETTTLFSDHTGYLPEHANATNEDSADTRTLYDGFNYFPFFRYASYHWTIRSSGRWECDNADRYQDDTLHQVWAR